MLLNSVQAGQIQPRCVIDTPIFWSHLVKMEHGWWSKVTSGEVEGADKFLGASLAMDRIYVKLSSIIIGLVLH